ncbi:MAG: hypothetical protein KIT68_05405 [Phycisphaeraceae bacterium]|nr:hypothetical protein [Phycisphaeraceae bacterium]
MPRTVRGPGGELAFTNLQWGMLMKTAHDFGWKPQGTLAPANWDKRYDEHGRLRPWHRNNYFSKAGQTVESADAAAIADALESILPDVPDHDALAHKVISSLDLPQIPRPLRMLHPGAQYNAFEFFSGPNKDLLRRFIHLCRAGGFEIR